MNLSGVLGFFVSKCPDFDSTAKEAAHVNAILPKGLRDIASVLTFLDYCHIGTNSDENSQYQEGLNNPLHFSNDSNNLPEQRGVLTDSNGDVYIYRRITKRFSPSGNAENIAECGFGMSTQNVLTNRGLIRDIQGLPTTISRLPDEYLYVVYELRLYPPTVDYTGTFMLNGNEHTWTARAGGTGGVPTYKEWGLNGQFITAHFNTKLSSESLPPIFAKGDEYFATNSTYSVGGSINSVGPSGKIKIKLPSNPQNFPISLITRESILEGQAHTWNIEISPPILNSASSSLELTLDVTWDEI